MNFVVPDHSESCLLRIKGQKWQIRRDHETTEYSAIIKNIYKIISNIKRGVTLVLTENELLSFIKQRLLKVYLFF